jgi:hypothetical protein
MGAEKAGSPETWDVRRLWSLTDMMNFVLGHFLWTMKLIDQEISICYVQSRGEVPLPISDDFKNRFSGLFQYATAFFRRMDLTRAMDRLERIDIAIKGGTSWQAMFNELKVLKEAVEDDIKLDRFYHYPKSVAELPIRFKSDWAATLTAFPSKEMEFEVRSGVDCYALEHPTAAIFHFMRTAEYGLRALARERRVRLGKNKPIEWATWQQILQKLGVAQREIEGWKAGDKKDAALSFYTGAIASLHSFKNEFRNMVMHVRKEYEMEDAAKAMRQVRDFMNDISKKVGENTTGSIKTWV